MMWRRPRYDPMSFRRLMFCAVARRRSASVVYLPTSSRSLLISSSFSSNVFLFSTACLVAVVLRVWRGWEGVEGEGG